ncbi:Protein-disulfide isomerase [Tsukamurella pulmonis]|uniref:Protein-disulfide isomerase n=2 Tax=Tsukamurella pulmonis TaxID=47312 RepID=A0A1H1HAH9_9ACTN|nr:Protein-disulfide isomerase [Tsukamurella pulmonis]SUP15437.1 Serine/threonine-protein kinase pknE [Tsukamurella pulmonis]
MHRGISVVAAVLLALFALTGCARSITGTAVAEPGGTAAGASAGSSAGAVRVGTGGESITIYVDFLCPACKTFEDRDGDAIGAAVAAGKLTVEYRPVSFLDPQSASGDYSSRALRAFLAVGRDAPASAVPFLRALFAAQPQEAGSTDATDQQLADRARGAGAPDDVAEKIRTGATGIDGKAVGAANVRLLAAAGGTGTPTVLHNGAPVVLNDPGWLPKITG